MANSLGDALRVILFVLLASLTFKSVASIQFKTSALLSSPAMSFGELDSSWPNPTVGDHGQARFRMETAFGVTDSVDVGLQKRVDYLLAFNHQTAQFYSALEQNQVPDEAYDLFLKLNAASSNSLFLDYQYALSSASDITVRANLLRGERLQIASLTGSGQVSDESLEYLWDFNYAYDENRLFDQPKYGVTGWGHSFDFRLRHRFPNNGLLTFSIEDAFHTLYWQGVEQDSGCLSRPLQATCSVSRNKQNLTQKLPVFVEIDWQQPLSKGVDVILAGTHWQRYSGLSTDFAIQNASLGYDWLNKTYNLGYESEYLRVKWGFDQMNYHGANQWQILLDITWPIYDL